MILHVSCLMYQGELLALTLILTSRDPYVIGKPVTVPRKIVAHPSILSCKIQHVSHTIHSAHPLFTISSTKTP
ncbi:unnamed protein product [Nezara viridula]|uniref:Uncharacterized protein n=1 Tax=Nezara viridula TaxID=85310 RepID=A0A9P0H395_NEZVI|nr:unnamed protein product [Nezara viridula]